MDLSEHGLTRRTALKGLGLAGGTALVGGVGIAAFTGSIVAVSEFEIRGDGSTFETNDGRVSAVIIDPSGKITWDGLDHDADTATVTIEAENDEGDLREAATKELELINRKSGSVDFDIEPIDLTTLKGLGDDYFSSDKDGEVVERSVTLKVSVVVDTDEEGYSVSDEREATMNTAVLNEDKDVGGDAEASTYDAYSGPIYDKDDNKTDDEAYLYVHYEEDSIVMEMDLRNYLDQMEGEPPINAAIGVDVDEDNVGDYQFGWLPGIDEPEFAVKEGDLDNGWSSWKGAGDHDAVIDKSKSGGIVRFELDRGVLGINPDDTYLTGYLASAGGEEEYVAVSAEPPKFWSSENKSTASEYWIQARAK